MQTKKECIKSKYRRLFLAGIDFGTTFSGYAFSFRSDWKNVAVISRSSGHNYVSSKSPTILLLNPDKSFLAFGFGAKHVYMNLREDSTSYSDSSDSDSQEEAGCITKEEWRNYYYFRDFKMSLLNKNVSFLMFYFLNNV